MSLESTISGARYQRVTTYSVRKSRQSDQVDAAREPKVGDLQVAVLVDEQVGGLEVAVEHVARVDVLEAAEELVEEVLDVLVGERLRRADHLVQVGVHQVRHHVQVGAVGRAAHQVADADDILVVEVEEELDLAERALGGRLVLEDVADLLDRDEALRRVTRVHRRADHAVRAAPDKLLDDVAAVDGKVGATDGRDGLFGRAAALVGRVRLGEGLVMHEVWRFYWIFKHAVQRRRKLGVPLAFNTALDLGINPADSQTPQR